jgi:DNA-binding beta-propeller fold protein YncE
MRITILALLAGALASIAGAAGSSPTVVAKIAVAPATSPCAAAAGGGFVWVSDFSVPYLLKIDPRTNKIIKKTRIGNGSCGLGFGAGSLWIEDTNSSTVSRVSAATGKRIAVVAVGAIPYDATFAYGAAWATSNSSGEVDRIDPRTNKVAKRWKLGKATGVVGAFGSIWATGTAGVLRIDPATNKLLARIPVKGAGWTAASDDAVWVTNGSSGVTRIDPATNRVVATVPLGTPALGDPAVVAGQLWVPKIKQANVAVIDPATNQVVQTVSVGTGPFVITEIAGEAWIPSWQGTDIWRLRP